MCVTPGPCGRAGRHTARCLHPGLGSAGRAGNWAATALTAATVPPGSLRTAPTPPRTPTPTRHTLLHARASSRARPAAPAGDTCHLPGQGRQGCLWASVILFKKPEACRALALNCGWENTALLPFHVSCCHHPAPRHPQSPRRHLHTKTATARTAWLRG